MLKIKLPNCKLAYNSSNNDTTIELNYDTLTGNVIVNMSYENAEKLVKEILLEFNPINIKKILDSIGYKDPDRKTDLDKEIERINAMASDDDA